MDNTLDRVTIYSVQRDADGTIQDINIMGSVDVGHTIHAMYEAQRDAGDTSIVIAEHGTKVHEWLTTAMRHLIAADKARASAETYMLLASMKV